ncbi:AAA family ATPase [Candidatus Poriferisodalis sp.]|uniref:AAA family ATPase n=1 Tax=Candidatus Poriferisodalis sp. TaxID=3101277 RepID=UPI003B0193DF
MAITHRQAKLQESKLGIERRYPDFASKLFSFLERDESTICWANTWNDYHLSALRVAPSDAIRRQFGISNEIPVLIATYESSLQPRVLRQLDTSKELRESASADKDFAILVAADRNAEQFTKDRTRFSYPILTIYTNDLRDGKFTATNLRSEIAQSMRSMNHFDNSNEIHHAADFFGRVQDVEALTHLASVGQSVGIFGLRRAGKTSLIHQVRQQLERKGTESIYVQLNGVVDADDLRQALVGETAMVLRNKGGTVPENSGMLDKSFNLTYDGTAAKRWMYEMEALLHQINSDLVIVLDETDHANEEIAADDESEFGDRQQMNLVIQHLRGLIQKRSDRSDNKLSLLAAGTAASIFEKSIRFGRDNQLFGFASSRPLGSMPRDEMREMVRVLGKRSGLKFDDHRVFDSLLEEYGGHPHLTRQACARVVENVQADPEADVPHHVSIQDLEAVYGSTAENSPTHATRQTFRNFEQWYPDEAAAIMKAATDGQPAEPNHVTHAIDFGICGPKGNLRQRALRRELCRGMG